MLTIAAKERLNYRRNRMNALIIILLMVLIIGGTLALVGALAGVVLGSRITAKAMGGWFSPGPNPKAEYGDDQELEGAEKYAPPAVRGIRDQERSAGARDEESYPGIVDDAGIPDLPFPTEESTD